jgi:hypothetical protein
MASVKHLSDLVRLQIADCRLVLSVVEGLQITASYRAAKNLEAAKEVSSPLRDSRSSRLDDCRECNRV